MQGRKQNKPDKNENDKHGDINVLPNEVLVHVLQNLPASSLASTGRVSKHFYVLSNEQTIWKQKFSELEKNILKSELKAAYKIFWQKKVRAITKTSAKQACQKLGEFLKKSAANRRILEGNSFISVVAMQRKFRAAYKLGDFNQSLLIINTLITKRNEMIFMYPHCRTIISLPDIYYWRGCAHEKINQINAAVTDFILYIRGEGQNSKAHLHLADCYVIQKKFDLAIKHYKIYLDCYFKNNVSATLQDAPVGRILKALAAAEKALTSTMIPPMPQQIPQYRWFSVFLPKAKVAKIQDKETKSSSLFSL